MIKIIYAVILAVSLFQPILAFAQDKLGGVPLVNLKTDVDIYNLLLKIGSFAVGLIFAVAALFFIYAAYLYLFSGGEPAKTESAKKFIMYAIIGMVVAFISLTIVTIVERVIGVQGGESLSPADMRERGLR